MKEQEDYLITYLEEALADSDKISEYLIDSGNWLHTCSLAKIQTGLNQVIIRLKKQQDGKA